jgi:vacuolar-type H+-ATPase subunit H
MIDNIINQIKKTEKKAKEIVASSKKEYSSIIEEAYKKAEKITKDAEKEVKVMLEDARSKAKNEAAVEAAKLEKDFNLELAEIKNISEANREKAIKKIVQGILE